MIFSGEKDGKADSPGVDGHLFEPIRAMIIEQQTRASICHLLRSAHQCTNPDPTYNHDLPGEPGDPALPPLLQRLIASLPTSIISAPTPTPGPLPMSQGIDINIRNLRIKKGRTPLLITQGHRFGNFRPIAEAEAALSGVMLSHGIDPPPASEYKKH